MEESKMTTPLCTSFFASPVLLWEQFFFPTAVFIAPQKSHIALSPTTTYFIFIHCLFLSDSLSKVHCSLFFIFKQ